MLLSDRTFRTLVLAAILITVTGSFRPEEINGMYPSEYWAEKAQWEHCADIVLAGDSRTLIGLSPVEMRKHLPGLKIYNYGFGGVRFSSRYMDEVEEILKPDSENKIIIMGISPYSLTKRDAATGTFTKVQSMSDVDLFQPISFNKIVCQFNPSYAKIYKEKTFFANGWLAVYKVPVSKRKALRNYKMYYEARQVDTNSIDKLVGYVEEWVQQEIKVYGFIPPTCEKMHELESEMSGLDKEYLIENFREAGGIWIKTDKCAYDSFDGSHLQDYAAIRFTKNFCKKLIKNEHEN
jgi:hypothetical protein